MTSITSARNTAQSKPVIPAVGRLVSTSTVWYTCPTGKKATYKGHVIVDNFGAGSMAWVVAGGEQVTRKLQSGDQEADAEGVLTAGQTIGYAQDTGSNATIDGNWSIEEYAA